MTEIYQIYVLDFMMLAKRLPNVYMDCSYSLLYYQGSPTLKNLVYAMKSMKMERIFYGSDYPDREIKESLDLSCKDLGFATQLGREFDVPLPIASLVEQLNQHARDEFGGSAGSPMVAKLIEHACATALRAPGFPINLEEYLQSMPRAERLANPIL